MNPSINQAGLTLIELLLVMSLAVILTAIGVPSYRYVTTSNRIAGEINGLLGDLEYARYEAIKEGMNVQICPAASASANTCDAGQTTWSEGWIVLSNSLDNPSGTSVVLRRQLPFTSFNSNDTLTGSLGLTSLTFNREGFSTQTGSRMFSLHDPNNNTGFTRCLIIDGPGAMSTTTAGNTVLAMTCS